MDAPRDLSEDLGWLVERIRDEPEKIILFGSLARGDTHEWSDIDLIVVKDTDASYGERVKALTPLIRDRLVGADILVYSLEEYKSARDKGSSFLKEAERDGVVLYGGSHKQLPPGNTDTLRIQEQYTLMKQELICVSLL